VLYQLHHQNKRTLDTKPVAQRDCNSGMEKVFFVEETKKTHPLPSDEWQWVMLKEGHPSFVDKITC